MAPPSYVYDGLTDTCRNLVPPPPKRDHSNLPPVRRRSLLAARGDRPGDGLLRRRIRMLFGRLLEKQCHLIRFAENRRGATHHRERAGNIP
jgi:hypothetical protein